MAAKARFEELYNKAIQEEESLIVPVYAEMVNLGKELRYGYDRVMSCTRVGVHWKNRDEAMICGKGALQLWDDVDRTGVSPDLWRDATCIEEHGERKSETRFVELCENDAHLPKYVKGDIEASAIACSHWNQAIAAAKAGIASRPETIIFLFTSCLRGAIEMSQPRESRLV